MQPRNGAPHFDSRESIPSMLEFTIGRWNQAAREYPHVDHFKLGAAKCRERLTRIAQLSK